MSRYQPYPEYKDSGVEWIGELPAHWGVVPGKALFIEKKRKNTDLSGGDYLSLVAGRGVIPYEEKGDIGNRKPDDLDRCKLVEPGDHVINSMNFSIGAYGKSRFSGVCSPVYVILGENDRRLGEGFGELLLSNPSYQDFIQSFGSGILDHRRSIGWDEIKVAHVPCPPVQEQEEISAFVHRETTRIDTLVEKKQRFIELLEEKRQAVITQVVTKGLDPNVPMKDSGVEWIGEVPAHWELKRLGHIGDIFKGSGGNKSDQTEEGVPCLRYGEIYTKYDSFLEEPVNYVRAESASAYTPLQLGDVVFTASGEDVSEIGKAVAVMFDGPLVCGGDTIILRPRWYANHSTKFIGYLANAAPIAAQKSVSGTGFTVVHISGGKIKGIRMAWPRYDEQHQIATFLDRETTRIDTLIKKTRQSIDLLKERRAALITATVTGKIDVREEAA